MIKSENGAVMVIQCSHCWQLPELSEDRKSAHCANPACDEAGKVRPVGEWNAYHWPMGPDERGVH